MIGMYHLGCVNAAGLSNLGYKVTCFDFDEKVIDNLSKGIFPINEEGLPYYFNKKNGAIQFSKNISDVKDHRLIFITYDIGANGITIDIIDKIIKEMKPYLTDQIIVVRSQVPVGTCDKIKKETNCEVCYIPENFQLGSSMRNFFFPIWLVFGASSSKVRDEISLLFSKVLGKKLHMNLKEAEMVKIAMNCYLATMISFSGEISDICEENKINVKEVIAAIRYDKRVGLHVPITPGLGFNGGTLERDLKSIVDTKKTCVLNAVYQYNKNRETYIKDKLEKLLGKLDGKKITFFGATYKSGTDTLRDSPTVKIIDQLQKYTSNINVFDPMVKSGIKGATFIDIKDAKDSDAIIIMTNYKEFITVDYKELNPKVIIDTKGILPKSIKHYEIGVPYE